MKTIYNLTLIIILLFISYKKNDKINSNYNCHVITTKKGRCTGSVNCTVCRNCSRCAYCSNGGSCGVCGGGYSSSSKYNHSSSKKNKKSSTASSFYYSSKASRTYNEDETIIIYNDMINVRKGPGLKYEIIEKIYLGDSVTFIERYEIWLKVKVEKTGSIGFISSKILNQ